MSVLRINYEEVSSVLSGLDNTLKDTGIEEAYSQLISGFEESSGEEADALRELLRAEQKMTKELDNTLRQFTSSIRFAVNEFKQLDSKGAAAVAKGTKKKTN